MSSPEALRRTAVPGLTVRAESAGSVSARGHLFVRFVFNGNEHAEAGTIPIRMPALGDLDAESWWLPNPSEWLEHGAIRAVRNGDWLICSLSLPVDGDPYRVSAELYGEVLGYIRAQRCPHIVKAWNHLPAINEGDGDRENYKRFCLGRAEALDEHYDAAVPPAGTAVGAPAGAPLQVIVLASAHPPSMIENPRQVSAFRYPRQYGPRSPSFSRAVSMNDGIAERLLVSGTAAIVGHESRHEADLEAQIHETLENWSRLLSQHAQSSGQPATLDEVSAFRVYLRHAEDLPLCRRVLGEAGVAPERTVFLNADICRRELLFELDGIL